MKRKKWGMSSLSNYTTHRHTSPLGVHPLTWELLPKSSKECWVSGFLASKAELLSQNLSRWLSLSIRFIYNLERGLYDYVNLELQWLRYFILSPAEPISKFQSPNVSLLLDIFQEFWLVNAKWGALVSYSWWFLIGPHLLVFLPLLRFPPFDYGKLMERF